MSQEPDTGKIRARINQQFEEGDFTGWFETLYAGAKGQAHVIPWAYSTIHPLLEDWLADHPLDGKGLRAIVIGCGLGDDAEVLADLGFQVTAFDISPTAIQWAKDRFPNTTVDYQVADLFDLPKAWHGGFDFVLEIYTVQALPQMIRQDALKNIPLLLADGGRLLLACMGRDHDETPEGPPWALSHEELSILSKHGLTIIESEDLNPATYRRFRILYHKA